MQVHTDGGGGGFISHRSLYHQLVFLPFLKSMFTIKRRWTKAKCNHSLLIIGHRSVCSEFTDARLPSHKECSEAVSQLLSRVSCSKLNQGHRYPSQTFHPGMWTELQSSSCTCILPLTHSLLTKSMSITQWLKKQKQKKTRLKSTDCNLLLMFVFLGIFSRHFVNRFIYMEIYNFSLCKEVKDSHLNVVAESSMFTCAVNRRIPVSLGLP